MDRIFVTLSTFLSLKKQTIESYTYSLGLYAKVALNCNGKIDLAEHEGHSDFVPGCSCCAIEKDVQETTNNKFLTNITKFARYLKNAEVINNNETTGKHLSANTIKLRISAVRSFYAENEIVISKRVIKKLMPRDEDGNLIDDQVIDDKFTKEQAKKVLAELPDSVRAVFYTLFSSGMRIGECLKLKETDIDFTINPVRISIPKKYTKTGTARTTFVTTECARFLEDIWIPQREKYIREKKNHTTQEMDKHLLFPMTSSTVRKTLQTALINAGLVDGKGRSKLHLHSTRKSFRSILGEVSPDCAEVLLGHAITTDSRYVKKNFEECAAAYQKALPLLTIGNEAERILSVRDTEVENLKKELAEIKTMFNKYIDSMNGRVIGKNPG